jgi:nucleotidyltransferase/DNA polymerase involved in DNA repair
VVICFVGRSWNSRRAGEVAGVLLEEVPRVALGQNGVVWADGRGLDAVVVGRRVLERLESEGEEAGCGVAQTPVAAYAAAVDRSGEGVLVVATGTDREFLSERPLGVLEPDERLRLMLEGVGIETCGALAEVSREAVEVRFGAEAVGTWRLSRADDERRLFRAAAVDRPQATLDFVDYVVTDPEQLTFMSNRLLGGVCDALQVRGAHARRVEMVLPLANGETWRKTLRPSRPTASRTVWLRLVRRVLERLTVPDAVSGIEFQVLDAEAASAVQGDLFDPGFATAAAVDAALARLIEQQGPVVVRPETSAHPLPEERTRFTALDAEAVSEWSGSPLELAGTVSPAPLKDAALATPGVGLTFQLLRDARPIEVESVERRDHQVPLRYRDGEWRRFVTVSGPERISGGQWEQAYAREYFRGVSADGLLVQVYRDARSGSWYLQGWWD